jgi:type VI secretion system protein ImpB
LLFALLRAIFSGFVSQGFAMATDSGQKFIRRNRAPRVHITYEDPYDAERLVELPFVMGVMSDLSGNNPGVEKSKLDDRKFLEFDMDNFDSRMAAIQPGITMRVANKLSDNPDEKMSVNLRFNKMADLSPVAVARMVPATAKLLEAREQLSNLLRYMDGKVGAEDQLKKLLADPQLMNALKERAAAAPKEDPESESKE